MLQASAEEDAQGVCARGKVLSPTNNLVTDSHSPRERALPTPVFWKQSARSKGC